MTDAIDANGQTVTVGQIVTVTGTVTKVSAESVSIDVAPTPGVADVKAATISIHPSQVLPEGAVRTQRTAFAEYPKAIEPGVIATSREHEDELRLAPKKAAEQAKKDAEQKQKDEDAAQKRAEHRQSAHGASTAPPATQPGGTAYQQLRESEAGTENPRADHAEKAGKGKR